MSHAIIDHQAECQEPLDAICRQVWDCDCEWFNGMDGPMPDGTWTHEGGWDDDLDEPTLHRSHLQTPVEGKRLWCNIVEWIDCQGMWDCWTSAEMWGGSRVSDPFTREYPMDLPDGPIRYEWSDEWLDWDYVGATPALGAFIARQVVGRWAEALGLD